MNIETAIFNALLHTENPKIISNGETLGNKVIRVPVVCGNCYEHSYTNISATEMLMDFMRYKCPDCGYYQHIKPHKGGLFIGDIKNAQNLLLL